MPRDHEKADGWSVWADLFANEQGVGEHSRAGEQSTRRLQLGPLGYPPDFTKR